jgi:hypothetical protein
LHEWLRVGDASSCHPPFTARCGFVILHDVRLEQPSRPAAGHGGALDLGELMNYDVIIIIIIITEADFSDDPAFVYPFKANKIEDFPVGVTEAIPEQRRYKS